MIRRKRTKVTPELLEKMATAYESAETVAEVAYWFDCDRKLVERALVEHGMMNRLSAPGRPKEWTERDKTLVFSIFDNLGWSQYNIAKELGTSESRVSRLLVENNYREPGKKTRHKFSHLKDGYVEAWVNGHWSLEHRTVMSRILDRALEAHETVHHINGLRDDNRPENLQLRNGRHGKGVVLVCLDCGSHNVQAQALASTDATGFP